MARITLSAASMFDLTAGITVFCKLEVGGEQISVDRYCKVVTMQLTFSGSKLVCNVDIYEHCTLNSKCTMFSVSQMCAWKNLTVEKCNQKNKFRSTL